MKCIQYYPRYVKDGVRVARVPDREARAEVNARKALFVPKRIWKRDVRDVAPSNQ